MFRQFAALALGASLLHLNLQRADLACDREPANPAAAGHASHAAHGQHAEQSAHAHHGGAPAGESSSNHESCETPAQASCCQALTSCAISTDLGAERAVTPAGVSNEAAIMMAQLVPSSRNTAPEPPPPRA